MENIHENLTITTDLRNDVDAMQQILDLQQQNLETSLSPEVVHSEGFVTVRHDLKLLQSIGGSYGHVTAYDQDRLIAYALVMLPEYARAVPVLIPMFDMIAKLRYAGKPIREQTFFVMGQICVDKAYRGKGVVPRLYEEMRQKLSQNFSCVITEVASRNQRSLKAHQKVGFQCIHRFTDATDDWQIILWDWKNNS